MANIQKFESGKLSADMFASANKSFKEAAPEVDTSGGIAFLKLERGKKKWVYGQEEKEVPADSLWAVYPQSFATGYVAWDGTKVHAKVMASIGEEPVNEADLPPAPEGWDDHVGVVLVCVECKSDPTLEGTNAIFEGRAKGAIEGWTKLYDSVVARAKAGNEDFAAVVSLDATLYDHKKYGKVSKPLFKIDSWENPNDLAADFGESPKIQSRGLDDAKDAQPVKPESRRRIAADPKIEDAEIVDESPAPRRRRRQD